MKTDSVESVTTEAIRQHLGFQVRRAKQGMEAVIGASLENADLILMSVEMNIGALRAKIETANIRTIAIMGDTYQEIDEHCRALGFDAHVRRPIGLHDLEGAIHRLNQSCASPLR